MKNLSENEKDAPYNSACTYDVIAKSTIVKILVGNEFFYLKITAKDEM